MSHHLTNVKCWLDNTCTRHVPRQQGYLPDGVDGNRQGWREDFFEAIGLGYFKDDGYSRLGGINGKVWIAHAQKLEKFLSFGSLVTRTARISVSVSSSAVSVNGQRAI